MQPLRTNKRLKSWISAKDFNEQEKIKAVKSIYSKNLVDKSSEELMLEYYHLAMKNISRINGNDKIKNELIEFASDLMQRIN